MSDICSDATYDHRIDDPRSFNFCPIPGEGEDAFLFLGVAIAVACGLHFSRLQPVLVLLVGALFELIVFFRNLGPIGNAFTLWLVRQLYPGLSCNDTY
jgi:hypothetical protein